VVIKIYISLEKDISEKLARVLGVEAADSLAEAEGSILFFKNHAGGAVDLRRFITNPEKTVVAAGPLSPESEAFAEEAVRAGVPEKNIIFTPAKGIRPGDIQPLVNELFGARQKRIVKVPRVIGIAGSKGGVGRTTFAASLVAHYTSVSEKAVLLDVCAPPNGRYHITSPEFGALVEGSVQSIGDLTAGYRRVVVDVLPSFDGFALFERVVAVVDADMVQSVEPTAAAFRQAGISPVAVVYNGQRAEVPPDLISNSFRGCSVIAVEYGFSQCRAALAAGLPASMKNEKIALAVGKIAAAIDTEL
jgi:hypothetical protein